MLQRERDERARCTHSFGVCVNPRSWMTRGAIYRLSQVYTEDVPYIMMRYEYVDVATTRNTSLRTDRFVYISDLLTAT